MNFTFLYTYQLRELDNQAFHGIYECSEMCLCRTSPKNNIRLVKPEDEFDVKPRYLVPLCIHSNYSIIGAFIMFIRTVVINKYCRSTEQSAKWTSRWMVSAEQPVGR